MPWVRHGWYATPSSLEKDSRLCTSTVLNWLKLSFWQFTVTLAAKLKCYVPVDATWAYQRSSQSMSGIRSTRPPLLASVYHHDIIPGRHFLRVWYPYLRSIMSITSLPSSYRQTCNRSPAYGALVSTHIFCSRSKFWWGYTYRWISSVRLIIDNISCSSKLLVIFYSRPSFLMQFCSWHSVKCETNRSWGRV